MKEILCYFCNNIFLQTSNRSRFCSMPCKNQARASRKRERWANDEVYRKKTLSYQINLRKTNEPYRQAALERSSRWQKENKHRRRQYWARKYHGDDEFREKQLTASRKHQLKKRTIFAVVKELGISTGDMK